MVVAETVSPSPRTAVERVAIDYEPLAAVVDAVAAAEPGAPQLWDGAENVLIDGAGGRCGRQRPAAFAKAAHVVKLTTWIPRVTGVPMEPRAAVAEFDPASGRYTVHAGSGRRGGAPRGTTSRRCLDIAGRDRCAS